MATSRLIRFGVLGGTFDPVHAGHLAIARAAIRHLRLDHVLFIPARLSPFKHDKPTPARHRLAMLRLALNGMKHCAISQAELRRKGRSYTVDTLRALKRRHPGAELFLLLGADAAGEFRCWHRPGEIRRLATVVVFPRPGHRVPSGFLRLPMKPQAVSASGIRVVLAKEKLLSKGCLAPVMVYARRHGLYTSSGRASR